MHTWTSTQDEGWVRLAFDNFKVPYTYFAAPKLREGNLRSKYDVIIFPHAGQGGTRLDHRRRRRATSRARTRSPT